MTMYYVYKLIDPRDDAPFYIGKGTAGRIYEHEKFVRNETVPHGNKHLYERIRDILNNEQQIIYEKCLETEHEMEAYHKEAAIINELGLEKLCNITKPVRIGPPKKKNSTKTMTISVSVPFDIGEFLDEITARHYTNRSQMLLRMILDWKDNYERQNSEPIGFVWKGNVD